MKVIDLHYKVLKELGRGNFGVVYKVKDIRDDKIYALKLFTKLGLDDIKEKLDPQNMYLLTKMNHPNVIKIYDFGVHKNTLYCLFEYFSEQKLSDFRLTKENLPIFYEIIVKICYGLNYLHSQDIIHRDLKLDNVLYHKENGTVSIKIVDYGFNKVVHSPGDKELIGSLPYIAPEVLQGKGFVPESDFFSLGVILYYLSTGNYPFSKDEIGLMESKRFQKIIPKFPHKINPIVSRELENIILDLLELDSSNRIHNATDIIRYINKIQDVQYDLVATDYSLINIIESKNYYIRNSYLTNLKDYVNLVYSGNGKIVALTGDFGVGKAETLSYFRKQILSGEHFLFDYNCDSSHKDPFFALVKELYCYVKGENKDDTITAYVKEASDKLQEFFFRSEEDALELKEDKQSLEKDFELVKNLMFMKAKDKPLIFIIRNLSMETEDSIKFLRYISKDIINHPILIVITIENFELMDKVYYCVRINVTPLNYEETAQYIKFILEYECPVQFIQNIYKITNGNLYFIRHLLSSMIKKGQISTLILNKQGKYNFDIDWSKVMLPKEIEDMIDKKISEIPNDIIFSLKQISVLRVPISVNLSAFILNIDKKEAFFLLDRCYKRNVIIFDEKYTKNGYYKFIYPKLQEKLQQLTDDNDKEYVSKKVIAYFQDKEVTVPEIMQGIIQHSLFINDYLSATKYYSLLSDYYHGNFQREYAYQYSKKAIELAEQHYCEERRAKSEMRKAKSEERNAKGEERRAKSVARSQNTEYIGADKLKQYLIKFMEICNSNGYYIEGISKYEALKEQIEPNFKILFYYGLLLQKYASHQKAIKVFNLSRKYANDSEKIDIEIHLIGSYCRTSNDEARKHIDKLINLDMSHIQRALFYNLIGIHYYLNEYYDNALQYLRKGEQIAIQHKFQDILARIYNNTALIYNVKNNLKLASEYFQMARQIWEKRNNHIYLASVYNNIGDIELKRGNLNTAYDNFTQALKYFEETENRTGIALGKFNLAETTYKMGDFKSSDNYYKESLKIARSIDDKKFEKRILSRYTFLIGKIRPFQETLNFIAKNSPMFYKTKKPTKIDAFVKSYCFYLYNIGEIEELEKIYVSIKESELDYSLEQEFISQIQGWIHFHKKEYNKATEFFKTSINLAEKNENEYAYVVDTIPLIKCYYNLGNYKDALIYLKKVSAITQRNGFKYWKYYLNLLSAQINMYDKNVHLRQILRELLDCEQNFYDMNCLVLLVHTQFSLFIVYNALKIKDKSQEYFRNYQNTVKKLISGLDEKKKASYLAANDYQENIHKVDIKKYIVPRESFFSSKMEPLFLSLIYLRDRERVKFFIGKQIRAVISPYKFAIITSEEIAEKKEPFIRYNFYKEEVRDELIYKWITHSLNTKEILYKDIDDRHYIFVPLILQNERVGVGIFADNGELVFTNREKMLIKRTQLYLTILLYKIGEHKYIEEQQKKIAGLLESAKNIYMIMNLDELLFAITKYAIHLSGAERGFFVRIDKNDNLLFKVNINKYEEVIPNNNLQVSTTIIKDVSEYGLPIITLDAMEHNEFNDSLSIRRNELHSIYCSPVKVNNKYFGYLYLDNLGAKEKILKFDEKLLELFLLQVSVAIKNALDYSRLENAHAELKKSDKIRREFIHLVSHELNTPLTTLSGYLKMLSNPEIELNKKLNEVIPIMKKNIERLINSSQSILRLGEVKNIAVLEKKEEDINEVIKEVYSEMKLFAKQRNQNLIMNLAQDLPKVKINRDSINSLLNSLISNAIKFTDNYGKITIGSRISRFQNEKIEGQTSLVIYVEDNGIGVPLEEQENIFKEFYLVGDINSHHSGLMEYKSSGLGLGLAVAKTIVDLHNGKIWVKSNKGEGSIFFVSLPLHRTGF